MKIKCIVLLLLLGNAPRLLAQNWDQIIKTVASDRAQSDWFGYSVAISGEYAIVGAYREDAAGGSTLAGAGSAYVFKRSGTTWVQQAKLVASDRAAGDSFGWSVSISGEYAIVGALYEDENAVGGSTLTDAGSAYVFKRTDASWTQQAKLVASDRVRDDRFGNSVAISGEYIIVGAEREDENAVGGSTQERAGSAYIFKRTNTNWAQQAKLVAADRAAYDYFGWSVAISGEYAIVGAPGEDENAVGGARRNRPVRPMCSSERIQTGHSRPSWWPPIVPQMTTLELPFPSAVNMPSWGRHRR